LRKCLASIKNRSALHIRLSKILFSFQRSTLVAEALVQRLRQLFKYTMLIKWCQQEISKN
ncbi:hypothetical protein OQI89_12710, partial [Lentilactobacillus diolivorans]|uniref:hypothetical protein n=1 Tax=Lentilactobacillus diolivorans TaxID=179838 RepID=UPI0024689433